MFTAAALRSINLLIALLVRLAAGWRGSGKRARPPARRWACLEKTAAALAQAIRAALQTEGETAPDLSDAALVAWFAKRQYLDGCAGRRAFPPRPLGKRGKAMPSLPRKSAGAPPAAREN